MVDVLIKRKFAQGAWKPHPELPDLEEARLYNCFAEASSLERTTAETEIAFESKIKMDEMGTNDRKTMLDAIDESYTTSAAGAPGAESASHAGRAPAAPAKKEPSKFTLA